MGKMNPFISLALNLIAEKLLAPDRGQTRSTVLEVEMFLVLELSSKRKVE